MKEGIILYIKLEQNPQVDHPHIVLQDVCDIWCKDKAVLEQCKKITLAIEQEGKANRHIYSALELIERIQKVINDAEVIVLGEEDIIVAYVPPAPPKPWWQWMKAAFVCAVIFFGSAFAIMTFNRDVSVDTLFDQLYQLATGQTSEGFNVLEISYSVGMAVGILTFYNHFSKKKILGDPTPLEVEMRQYESDICNTIIADIGRKNKEDG